MAKQEPTTVEALDEMLASTIGMINLMRAALPRKGSGTQKPVIHQIAARYEPHCRAVHAALAAQESKLDGLAVEIAPHYTAPRTNRVIRCWWKKG